MSHIDKQNTKNIIAEKVMQKDYQDLEFLLVKVSPIKANFDFIFRIFTELETKHEEVTFSEKTKAYYLKAFEKALKEYEHTMAKLQLYVCAKCSDDLNYYMTAFKDEEIELIEAQCKLDLKATTDHLKTLKKDLKYFKELNEKKNN